MSPSAPPLLSVQDFKSGLQGQRGLVLDIDETLSWTVGFWMERMQKLFGNPEKLSVKDMADKYHLTQNVPYWQTDEAHAWMQSMRDKPEAQEELPVIEGALEGVKALQEDGVALLGYLTVRPQSVVSSTRKWLLAQGFPDLPIVAKPDDVSFSNGNKWKGEALRFLYPEVWGIVDDNPKVPLEAGSSYEGTVFLFAHDACKEGYEHAIPCKTWKEVVEEVKKRRK